MKYLDIIIDNKSRATDNIFTYTYDGDISVGQKVYVPFARSKTLREGYVFAIHDTYEGEYKLKSIDSLDENIRLNEEMVETCRWMRQRYLVKYIDGIHCFVPPGGPSKRKLKERARVEVSEDKKQLTMEQQQALDVLFESLNQKKHEIFLIHGVTSSGKTEVYMQAIEGVLAQGRTAIMMVPEVALTKQIIERFERRFGSDSVAIIHYKLTKAQRYEQWQKIRAGKVRIVIGARSAVFAPLEDIGLIILDEEHESTYKSDMTPKYDTLEVAIKRAKAYGGSVVLGSATPSVVSTYRAEQGIYKKIELTKRYNENPLPQVTVVDMNEEHHRGNNSIFSNLLYSRIRKNLEEGRQVMLMHNRRGYSTYITCDGCGNVERCPDCGISLTYHKNMNGLKCHYCGRSFPYRRNCPQCGGEFTLKGTGTQKLEEQVEKLFPGAVYDRLDLDISSKAGGTEKVLTAFRKRKTDILIGTQLIAKGLDFDNVGLVGILNADHELNIPDYRSSERTFQLLTQSSGRAGRGNDTGEVIIQTFSPENFAVLAAQHHDYRGFYENEIRMRQRMDYPPFADIIKLQFTGEDECRVKALAEGCYSDLRASISAETMFYPTPSPMNKIKEIYRYQMLLKCPRGARGTYLKEIYRLIEKNESQNKVNMVVDVNPYSFT